LHQYVGFNSQLATNAGRYSMLLLSFRFGHSLHAGGHAVGASTHFALEGDTRTTALSVADWLRGFHPHISLTVTDHAVELQSDRNSIEELAAIWTAAVVNEALLARGRDGRQVAFKALAR
jgi:hypothetical protein